MTHKKKLKRKREEEYVKNMDISFGNNIQNPTHSHQKKKKRNKEITGQVRIRQKVQHKRSFYYLEQLILKHKINTLYDFDVEQLSSGIDLNFANPNDASKFSDFITSLLPIHVTKTKMNDNFNLELSQVCKYDLVCLPQRLYQSMGNYGPIVICFKVTSNLYFIDPKTLIAGEISANQFFYKGEASFKPLFMDLIKFTVLDVNLLDKKNGNYQMAHVQVCKESEIGLDNSIVEVSTHLGNILQVGDTVYGYDLKNSNINDEILESYKSLQIPDVVLVKKHYDRPAKRYWKLLEWKISRDDDYESFLDELEEDKEMRSKINLFKDESMKIDSTEAVKKLKNVPHVELEELIEMWKI